MEATRWPPALDLYDGRITNVALTDIADVGLEATLGTIATAVSKGTTRIHLADHGIARNNPALLADILNPLARIHQRERLYILGTIIAMILWPSPVMQSGPGTVGGWQRGGLRMSSRRSVISPRRA